MSRNSIFILAVALLLSACGRQSTPSNNPPNQPPLSANEFTMSCAPSPFVLARGAETKLTISVQRTSGTVNSVRVSYSPNSIGIDVVPSSQTITLSGNSGSAEFTVRAAANTSDNRPFFYMYGQGLGQNNSTDRQMQRSCSVQWGF